MIKLRLYDSGLEDEERKGRRERPPRSRSIQIVLLVPSSARARDLCLKSQARESETDVAHVPRAKNLYENILSSGSQIFE